MRRIEFKYPHIDVACVLWGRQKRRIDFGAQGYPPISILGRLIAEGFVGAAQGQFAQYYAEVFTGDAREIAIAMKGLELDHREALYFYYVVPGITMGKKAHILGIHRNTLTDRLQRANERLFEETVQLSHFSHSQLVETVCSQG